jgi:hypothetical protein
MAMLRALAPSLAGLIAASIRSSIFIVLVGNRWSQQRINLTLCARILRRRAGLRNGGSMTQLLSRHASPRQVVATSVPKIERPIFLPVSRSLTI